MVPAVMDLNPEKIENWSPKPSSRNGCVCPVLICQDLVVAEGHGENGDCWRVRSSWKAFLNVGTHWGMDSKGR